VLSILRRQGTPMRAHKQTPETAFRGAVPFASPSSSTSKPSKFVLFARSVHFTKHRSFAFYSSSCSDCLPLEELWMYLNLKGAVWQRKRAPFGGSRPKSGVGRGPDLVVVFLRLRQVTYHNGGAVRHGLGERFFFYVFYMRCCVSACMYLCLLF